MISERFSNTKQNAMSVSEYTELFEDLVVDVQEENPDLTANWFVKCYVNGLEGIKFQLRPLRPTTLTEAFWQAKDMEQAHPVLKAYVLHHFQHNRGFRTVRVQISCSEITSCQR
jgi:hypothetical protein